MSPKRGDDVPPPPVGDEWRLRFATNEAAKGWGDLCTEAPGNTRRCFEALRNAPCPRVTPIDSTGSEAAWRRAFSAGTSYRSGSTR